MLFLFALIYLLIYIWQYGSLLKGTKDNRVNNNHRISQTYEKKSCKATCSCTASVSWQERWCVKLQASRATVLQEISTCESND